jgi:hypothetical protein
MHIWFANAEVISDTSSSITFKSPTGDTTFPFNFLPYTSLGTANTMSPIDAEIYWPSVGVTALFTVVQWLDLDLET